MTDDRVRAHLPLTKWEGERGTYHLVTFTGEDAEAIAMHERLRRLELGDRRGFGSVKVMARIGATGWKTSVFPQRQRSEWVLLISRKVMRAEDLQAGRDAKVEIELI